MAGVKEGKGMVLPFTPLSLTFHHLNYYVDLPKVLLETALLQLCVYLSITLHRRLPTILSCAL